MINLDIQWSDPYQWENRDGDMMWRRMWKIPVEYRPSFFAFWNKAKFNMWNEGFSVSKIDNDWYLYETKVDPQNFKEIGGVKPSPPPEEEFWLPPYKVKNESGLRSWQVDSVSKLVTTIHSIKSSIDGSELGTGKTFTACGVARELDVPFVVVCPKAVKSQWNNVICNHFKLNKNLIDIVNYEMLIRGKSDSKIASYIENKKTHREKLKFKLPRNTLIIWDEAHKLKNSKTKTAKMAMLAFKEGYKMLFLSGSIATTPLELKVIGHCLKMFNGNKQYYEWLYSNGVSKGRWGLEFNNDKKSLNKIHKVLFKDKGVRIKRDDIPNFPECEIIADSYDMDDEIVSKINSIYKEMGTELQKIKDKIKQDKTENELVIRLRARQKCEILKVPIIVDLIEEGIESGMSVVVFLNYSDTIDAVSKKLNTTCIFDGRTDDKVREENKRNFQKNIERVILINNSAGGVGLDLPDLDGKHPRLSIISPDDSAQKIKQVTGRIWRESSKSKSVQKLFFIKGTVEENVMINVQQKLNNLDILNDGDLKI